MNEGHSKHVAILRAVQAIPAGHVQTYGQVAEAAGLPRRARLVGAVLRGLPEQSDVPWHRVVNAAGRVSRHGDASEALQRRLLEREGVTLDEAGRIDLEVYACVRRRRKDCSNCGFPIADCVLQKSATHRGKCGAAKTANHREAKRRA